MCDLFGGSSDSKNLKSWQSSYVNPGQLSSSLDALSTPSNFLKGFTGGGMTGGFDANGNANVSIDSTRAGQVSGLQGAFQTTADQLGGLASQWAPGASALRAAHLTDLSNQQHGAISNLRQNLQNRRVLGSSFAQNQLDSTDLAYQQQRDQTQAQDYQTELQNTASLVQAQGQASQGVYQTAINESNLEAGVGGALQQEASSAALSAAEAKAQILGGIAQGAQAQEGQNQRTAAQLDQSEASGLGSLFGTVLGLGTGKGTTVGGDIFSTLAMAA